MGIYSLKPETVQALQFTQGDRSGVNAWLTRMDALVEQVHDAVDGTCLVIHLDDGPCKVQLGDWVVVRGDHSIEVFSTEGFDSLFLPVTGHVA
ncbi:MAG: hypothetical protein AAF674_16940 [Pseudomonadota bacterium]